MPVFSFKKPHQIGVLSPADELPMVRRLVAEESDRRLVIDLARRVADAGRLPGPPDSLSPLPRPEGIWSDMASTDRRRVVAWLALGGTAESGEAVGLVTLVASLTAAGRRHSLGWLLVDAAHRREGIGRRLVAVACDHAWAIGAEQVWVETLAGWPAAVAFWRAVGFEMVSVRP